MNTRIQLNSKTANVDVYKQMPSTDVNKRYALTVERLTLPPMSHGLIFNQPLFEVERRLRIERVWGQFPGVGDDLNRNPSVALPEGSWIFTPHQCKTANELVYQMNAFFRRKILGAIASAVDWEGGGAADVYEESFNMEQDEDLDWYALLDTELGKSSQGALEGILRPDGKIGLKFTNDGFHMFVIKMTAEGKRIFGWGLDYIALDVNNTFDSVYLSGRTVQVGNDNITVLIGEPTATQSVMCVFDNSIFNHGHYRHEIAILTSLPMRNYLECDQRSAKYKSQLASYRYPTIPMRIGYRGTLFRRIREYRKTRYLFEQSTKTHNTFILTGSELQNFHMRLVSRNYKWNTELEQFDIAEIP